MDSWNERRKAMAEGLTSDELDNRFAKGPHAPHMARAVAAMADALQALDDEHVEEALYGDIVDLCDQYGIDVDEVMRLSAARSIVDIADRPSRTATDLAEEATACIDDNKLTGDILEAYLRAWLTECATRGDLDAMRADRPEASAALEESLRK